MEKRNIPFSQPDIIESDLDSVLDVIKSGWLAHGIFSKKFEKLFCKLTGAKYATTVSNCTAGLHLSCIAAGFNKGDEVIVPAMTHTATAHAVEYTGAKPVFADIDRISGNINIDSVASLISKRTKGIIPVHMAGVPCEMGQLSKLCKQNDVTIIEDCAHAMGTTFKGKHAGNFGITGNFSFYPTKQITTGEGGIVISNDDKVIDKIIKYKAFGINTSPEDRKTPGVYNVKGLGYNYRMTDFQAALGVGQLERYGHNVSRRRENAIIYNELLSGVDEIEYVNYNEDNSYFLFQISLSNKIDRNKLIHQLKDSGIGVSIHYAKPVPLMDYYKNKYGYVASHFPNAYHYAESNLSLPVHQFIKNDDIKFICNKIKSLLIKGKKL
jgi:perosamine synthetase